jgi:hypothetical protein
MQLLQEVTYIIYEQMCKEARYCNRFDQSKKQKATAVAMQRAINNNKFWEELISYFP